MSLLTLPNELILKIARNLLRCPACHQMTPDVSAISRSNHRLHALLDEYLLTTASTLHMLRWGIANTRIDTVALALERGADPNSPLRPNGYFAASWCIYNSSVDLAICMRVHSVDAELHAQKLGILALLFDAGGTCTVDSLIRHTRHRDLDLLTLSLPHLREIDDTYRHSGLRTLLDAAASRGYAEATKLVIDAGAPVNSIGDHSNAGFYPPLWMCWQSISVLQVLLDAGADPTWRAPNGTSVVQNMRQMLGDSPELEEMIALMVRYGACDNGVVWCNPGPGAGYTRRGYTSEMEYRGWVPRSNMVTADRARLLLLAAKGEVCRCLNY
ncbi:hypothetical protein Q9L58_005898 [Maublancomyces gigas]|uniref:Ankyrin n=1 Tax=Discina gigas TaxID=1032678 RepID=A0ABR3GGU6_9PEZI